MHLFAVRLLAVLALLCLRACYAHAFICRSFACSASTAVLEGLLSPKATSCKELALHLHRLSGVLCPPPLVPCIAAKRFHFAVLTPLQMLAQLN